MTDMPQQGAVKVTWDEEPPLATYATVVGVQVSDRDVTLVFAQAIPATEPAGPQPTEVKARLVARVVLAPKTAQELLTILASTILPQEIERAARQEEDVQ